MTTQAARRHIPAGKPVRQDFATRRVHELDNGQWAIRNIEDQLDMLRESARHLPTFAYERDEIEASRARLRRELIALRRAQYHPQPLRVSTFRRFLAWILS